MPRFSNRTGNRLENRDKDRTNTSNTFPVASGLVSYYKLNNSTDSVGGNNGTPTNVSYANAGKIGNCATMTAGYINLGTSANLNFIGAFSLSVWINIPNLTPYYMIITRLVSNGATSMTYQFYIIATSGQLVLGTVGYTVNSGVNAVPTGEWVHVVSTKDASNNVILYMNNAVVGSGALSAGTNLPTQPTLIGNRDDGNGIFTGSIDEVGFWNRALTAAEVALLYNGGAGRTY